MVSQAILLALRGLPGIYFHSLFGSRNDRKAALATGINRRINRQKFARAALESELADAQSLRAAVFGRYRALLQARSANAAFHPGGGQRVLGGDPRAFAVLRTAPDGASHVLCLHNVSNQTLDYEAAGDEFRAGITWTDLLNEQHRPVPSSWTLRVALRPYETRWLKATLVNPGTSP
jgi:sucrose phosphorylase